MDFDLVIPKALEESVKHLEKLESDIEMIVEDSLTEISQNLLEDVKQRSPRDTGSYANSWNVVKVSPSHYSLETDQGKLHTILEYTGQKPMKIEGNPLLSFEINGVKVIVHWVNHPGSKPQPHVRPALMSLEELAPKIFNKNISKYLLAKFL